MPKEKSGSKEFGAYLKDLREQKGLTRKELAELIKRPESTIENLEKGTVKPLSEMIEKIAGILEVSPEETARRLEDPRKTALMNAYKKDEEKNNAFREQIWGRIEKLYDKLITQYEGKPGEKRDREIATSLNILITRLAFLFFINDFGYFGKGRVLSFLEPFEKDPGLFREKLELLFETMNTPAEKRMDVRLREFPHIPGDFYSPKFRAEIPEFDDETVRLILKELSGEFPWSEMPAEVLGNIFESTISPETRRSGGIHYTSLKNVHRVIDPLFLESLTDELMEITGMKEGRKEALEKYIRKLSELKFLDPACGSGNFLTESYISLRRLENEAIKEMRR